MTVSIIIPTHNRGEKITGTLDSALAQTFAPLEILVIDDGSTDQTADFVVRNYGEGVRLIRQKNGGVARARNRGLREARGEWVAFLDHDDEFSPDKLEKFTPFLTSQNDVVISRWREVSGDGAREIPLAVPQNAFGWLFGWHNPVVSMSVPLVRRSALEKVGGFDSACVPADDWDVWLRLAKSGARFAFCDAVLTDYHLHDGQQRRDLARMFRATRRVLGKHPLDLARRPLLLWWFLWSGAFVASAPFYDAAKDGAPLLQTLRGALWAHPLAPLSPQWMALLARRLRRFR